jgi:hypothetical protein
VIEAFKKIIKEAGDMRVVGFDGGSEFKTKFKAMLKAHNIDYYVSDPGDKNKMAMIERFHRTLRDRISKYMTSYNTNKWVDVLDKILFNYNNTIHSTTKFKPDKVGKKEFEVVQKQKLNQTFKAKNDFTSFKVGQKVRLKKTKELFEKKSGENFYRGVYSIAEVLPFAYRIKNESGEIIKKTIKPYELISVDTVNKFEPLDKDFDRASEVKEYKIDRKLKIEGVSKDNMIEGKRKR